NKVVYAGLFCASVPLCLCVSALKIMALTLFCLLLSGFGFGALTALSTGRGTLGRGLPAIGAIAGAAAAIALGGYVLITGQPFTFGAAQVLPLTGLAFRLDGLGAFFLVTVGLIGMAAAIYGFGYSAEYEGR